MNLISVEYFLHDLTLFKIFPMSGSVKTYIMSISKNLWLKNLRTLNRETPFTDIYNNQFFEELAYAAKIIKGDTNMLELTDKTQLPISRRRHLSLIAFLKKIKIEVENE